MSLVAVPNVSEGRDPGRVEELAAAVRGAGAAVLDVHSDPVHNRSVITAHGDRERLVAAMARLAAVAAGIVDLTQHEGVHPRLGGLDVCPFVVDDLSAGEVVAAARAAGAAIWEEAALPVYLYGLAATRPECEQLPDLRHGGLAGLIERSDVLPPDFGTTPIDPRRGVACVGARGPLIAFNVWLRCELAVARSIAAGVRGPGIRALGLDLGGGSTQVSMNLTDPARAGIDLAFDRVARGAAEAGVAVEATEIVGLPPKRYLPDPDAQAARLLIKPGRSLERALAGG